MGYDYIENYIFGHGAYTEFTEENDNAVEKAQFFEEADSCFLALWKIKTLSAETYCNTIISEKFNYGVITTVEVYLIKAE
ncbi:hypothetical protein B0E44_16055 [Flavobacterium sp. A45]|nr:hypothetical protein B0E44_16055 [Flavobacterium sp. A45]